LNGRLLDERLLDGIHIAVISGGQTQGAQGSRPIFPAYGNEFCISRRKLSMSTLRAFLWGGAIGAILGLLFAPKRGEETRAELQSRLNQLQGQAQERMTELRGRANTAIEQGRQSVNTTLGKTQSATNRAADAARDQIGRTS
jgi:gas vesicle protein